MAAALHTVAETSGFLRDAKDASVTEAEHERIVSAVSASPDAGVEVVGSGGVRKVRIAGRGKGKSGGFRIMVAYVWPGAPAYVLALLSKGDDENFSAADVGGMKTLTTSIREYWRARKQQRRP